MSLVRVPLGNPADAVLLPQLLERPEQVDVK